MPMIQGSTLRSCWLAAGVTFHQSAVVMVVMVVVVAAVMVAPVPRPTDRAAAWLSCEAGQVSCLSTELCTLLPVSLLPVLVLRLWPLGELFESMCWTCSGKLAQWARQNSCFTSAHVAWLAARYMAED